MAGPDLKRLSSPITEIRDSYDVVVVGSGYGGAIMAARIAERAHHDGHHGLAVCVLERGLELRPGDYPDSLHGALPRMQIDTPHGRVGARDGLYDVRLNDDVNTLVGCGLGGTSLINAGVLLRPDETVFDDRRWPRCFHANGTARTELDEGYQDAKTMLGAVEYPRQFHPRVVQGTPEWPELSKLSAMRQVSRDTQRALIAVSFATAVEPIDRHELIGVQHHRCTLCGDCVSGCNHGAKNSLITNYLPLARAHGASIFCGVEVRRLERLAVPRDVPPDEHYPWRVYLRLLSPVGVSRGRDELFFCAKTVILSAGTLGSTEILLRSAEHGLSLSERLGEGFNANGDMIGFSYNSDRVVRGIGLGRRAPTSSEPVGPTITAVLRSPETFAIPIEPGEKAPEDEGAMVVQEGAIPKALAPLTRWLLPLLARTAGERVDETPWCKLRRWSRELHTLVAGPYFGAARRTQTWLIMSREPVESEDPACAGQMPDATPSGRLRLVDDRIRIEWPGAGSSQLYHRIDAWLRRASRTLGATYVPNPVWRTRRQRLFTVHPLGGCCMGDDVERGVVDHAGRVFLGMDHSGQVDKTRVHPGLWVCDGSIVPRSLGVNPLWTISALAERSSLHLVRSGRPWPAMSMSASPPLPISADDWEASRARAGLRFSERLVGELHAGPGLDREGPATVSRFAELRAAIVADDLGKMLSDSSYKARFVGLARIPVLSEFPLVVTEGNFGLFEVDADAAETRKMTYKATLRSRDGRRFEFEGAKVIHDQPFVADLWKDVTSLPFRVTGPTRTDIWQGRLRLPRHELIRLLTTLTVTGVPGAFDRLRYRYRFATYFATTMFQMFGWPFAPPALINPYQARDTERRLRFDRLPETPALRELKDREKRRDRDVRTLVTEDQAEIRLTRFEGGDRGPVLLAPGFAMSSYAFRLPTIRENLTEYLATRGWDVWLLDYRASEWSRTSKTQFTVDDIAQYDFPAAVREIHARTGKPIQLLGHCVGSIAMLMAALKGYVPRDRIQSMICSQFFTHIDQNRVNQLKALMHLGTFLQLVKIRPRMGSRISTASPFQSSVLDRLLNFYPSRELCRNPVCRRNLFLYGEVVRHDQLNRATHDAMYDLFAQGNFTSLRHLSRMIGAGEVMPARGRANIYLTEETAARLQFPITLIQGLANEIFEPRGGERTLAWLESQRKRWLESLPKEDSEQEKVRELYRLRMIPRYGHLDCFIGRNAAADVFPVLEEELHRGLSKAAP